MILTVFQAVVAGLLLLAGVIVTLWAPGTSRAKAWWVVGFTLLVTASFGLTIKKDRDDSKEKNQLAKNVQETRTGVGDLKLKADQQPEIRITQNPPPTTPDRRRAVLGYEKSELTKDDAKRKFEHDSHAKEFWRPFHVVAGEG